MSRLTIIVAATKSNGIGCNSRLPWHLPKDMKYFAQVTSDAPEGSQNLVIMGRKTWESIPNRFRPLTRRMNIVVSRNANYNLETEDESVILKSSLKSALAACTAESTRGFIIGGAQIYTESLAMPLSPTEPGVDRVLLTRILSPDFDCDVFLDDIIGGEKTEWRRASHKHLQDWVGFRVPEGEQEENGVKYEFQMWVRGLDC